MEDEVFEPYLTNPRPRRGGSKLSRIMKRAAQLTLRGLSKAEALRQAWAGKRNEMGVENMEEIMVYNPRRRRRSKRHNARRAVRRVRRVRRNVEENRRRRVRRNVAVNPRRRVRRSFRRHNPRRRGFKLSKGMSFGGIRLPSLIDLAALGGGAVVSEIGSTMAEKVHPIFATTWGKVGAKVIIAVGGAYAIKRFVKQPKAAKMFLIGAISPVVIDLAKSAFGAVAGKTVSEMGLGSREFPELGVYTGRQVGGLGGVDVYAPLSGVSELGV